MGTLLLTAFVLGDTTLPNTAGSCGPSSKVKTFETVISGDGRVDDYQLYFVSGDNQIVFMRTDSGDVYRSTDEGVTWEKQTVPGRMPHMTDDTEIHQIFHHEAKDKSIVIYLLSYGTSQLWLSRDKGNTYEYSDALPGNVYYLYLHPLFAGMLLARRWGTMIGNTQASELYLSSDMGRTWNRILDKVPPNGHVSWSLFPQDDPNGIYASILAHPESSSQEVSLVYSKDFFKTHIVIHPYAERVYQWYMVPPNRMVIKACADTSPNCATKEVFISEDGGKAFHKGVFPERHKDFTVESNFYIYELSDDVIWINVDRQCQSYDSGLCYGDLYHSSTADVDFTLSLMNARITDFTKYNSVDGIYINNQYQTKSGKRPVDGDYIRSLITYDRGSDWELIKAPVTDSALKSTNCHLDQGCSLHLHGYRNDHMFSWFYSVDNAPGVMIANGNLGTRLSTRDEDSNTFFSRNGGVDWTEVAKGPHVPEVGDHGAVVAMVPEDTLTDTLLFTVNDGKEWEKCVFTKNKFVARNIRVSQDWDSKRFIVYGHRRNEATGQDDAVVVHVNFDDEFTGPCGSSDFESWSPKDEHGQCVLGKYFTIQRRAFGNKCYLAEDHVHTANEGRCPCTKDDYECAHCFYRPDIADPCTLYCHVPNLPPEPKDVCKKDPNAYYELDQGYRLVEEDLCDATQTSSVRPKGRVRCGSDFQAPAPISPPSGSSAGIIIVLIVVVVLLALVGGVWYLWKYNDSFYNAVSYSLGIDDGRDVVTHYDQVETGTKLEFEDDPESGTDDSF